MMVCINLHVFLENDQEFKSTFQINMSHMIKSHFFVARFVELFFLHPTKSGQDWKENSNGHFIVKKKFDKTLKYKKWSDGMQNEYKMHLLNIYILEYKDYEQKWTQSFRPSPRHLQHVWW